MKTNVFLRKKGLNCDFVIKGSDFNGTLLELLNDYKQELEEAINYNRCCKPKGNCKITVLVTYEVWQDSGSAYFDDYKVTRNKILQVENLEDLNEMFTNLVDIKILK